MINIRTSNFINPEKGKLSILKPSRSFNQGDLVSSRCFGNNNVCAQRNPSQIIMIDKSQWELEQEILQWRLKTEFPIVKIKSWKILGQKQILQKVFFQTYLELESQYQSLQQIQMVPFFQAIYILKESLIGFERLYHRFGGFHVSAQMIKFNRQQQCKVWINNYCFTNVVNELCSISQEQFIQQLCVIIRNKTLKSKNSQDFYNKLQKAHYFYQAIGVLDFYTKTNKINILNSLQIFQQGKSALFKSSLNISPLLKENKKKNIGVSHKIPSFIKKNNQKKATDKLSHSSQQNIIVTAEDGTTERFKNNLKRIVSSNNFLKQIKKPKEKIKTQTSIANEDEFLNHINVRLIEPKTIESTEEGNNSPTSYLVSQYTSNKEKSQRFSCHPLSPFPSHQKIQEFNSIQDVKSNYSLNKKLDKERSLSSYKTASKKFLSVIKSKKNSQNYLSMCNPTKFYALQKSKVTPNKNGDTESFGCSEISRNPSTINLNLNKQKRKYSGDYLKCSKSYKQFDEIEQQTAIKVPEVSSNVLLRVPTTKRRNTQVIVKSPSHEVISLRKDYLQNQEKEQKQQQLLRQTILGKNGWTDLNLFNIQQTDVKQSICDGRQIPSVNSFTTSQLPILGCMGREIKSSMITTNQFQLEFQNQIQREKEVRNEVMDILG